ncbi:MAG TPA: type II secretion system major pseudopilin GspG [Spirochaetota bacterium]|jgi:general secretion pathway protein G|nr:type II secretion system major pseudopilin GspG [Spirochaetota bacterium]OQB00530.1 MAG: Type II secretion system protein G precursor [Spirochaetes bacterium ADurb.Bin218]HON16533.1 type II secretion system major pseudopilin GspG [Spirochaetota bacterium]HOQ12474.1 type II secretion system major pseudopilin GspG [Spirochaetota bacterium]HOV08070.1 type II secretion system major pseudopilin GspG [Spirochaetota bacterium]
MFQRVVKYVTTRINNVASDEGFTLLELMIVITIIAIIGGFAVSRFTSTVDKTKVTAVKTDFGTFETALEAYYLNHNSYPSTSEGLQKLMDEGLLKNKKDTLLDPWNNPYQYRYPGQFSDGPEIWSYGADGKEGGDGINADIKSWE